MSHEALVFVALFVASIVALPFLLAPLMYLTMVMYGAFRRSCEVEGDPRDAGPRPACSGLMCTRLDCKRRQMLVARAAGLAVSEPAPTAVT